MAPMSTSPDPVNRGGDAPPASPWQLVEVNTEAPVAQEWHSPRKPTQRNAWTKSQYGGRPSRRNAAWEPGSRISCWPASPKRESEDSDSDQATPGDGETTQLFDPLLFLGDWLDTLGHRILVSPALPNCAMGRQTQGRRRNACKDKDSQQNEQVASVETANYDNSMSFWAVLHKPNAPEKIFAIDRASKHGEWTCGNGSLVTDESGDELLVWLTFDGRKSRWTRAPPMGPVFFDAPVDEEDMAKLWLPHAPLAGEENVGPAAAAAAVAATRASGKDSWNLEAPEFVPTPPSPSLVPTAVPRAPIGIWGQRLSKLEAKTPGKTPQPSPCLGPAAVPAPGIMEELGAATTEFDPKTPINIHMDSESTEMKVDGSNLEWHLPDGWGELRKLPKDFSITSPLFGVRDAANMQLAFYPNGSRTAEEGQCTVALTRSPESSGIKFEFLVNGRSIGPKVCLGRRYLGDFATPVSSEDDDTNRVVVSMRVLDILGE